MKDWKRHTREHIPEILEKPFTDYNFYTNPMSLWIELDLLFWGAIRKGNEDLIQRIFKEAVFYLRLKKVPNDFNTAVSLAFLENLLVGDKRVWDYLIKYFPKDLYVQYKEVFVFAVNPEVYEEVLGLYKDYDFTKDLKK